jgi:hypothetical protein
MQWQPTPHQPLYPPIEEIWQLLNFPKTFQKMPLSKQHTSTEWSGSPSSTAEGLKKPSTLWTNESGPLRPRGKKSMDELWQSVPYRKTSKLGSGRSMKPYYCPREKQKQKLSHCLGLPDPQKPRRSLAERLGVPRLPTCLGQPAQADQAPQPEEVLASEPPSLLKCLQPLSLLQ